MILTFMTFNCLLIFTYLALDLLLVYRNTFTTRFKDFQDSNCLLKPLS